VGWSAGFPKQPAAAKNQLKSLTNSLDTTLLGKVNRKMKVSGAQVLAARDLLGITQQELADAAGVSFITVHRFEAGQAKPQAKSLQKILSELQRRGIEFTNGDGAGVRINYAKAAEYARLSGQALKETDR
jgi:DNA-binding transcriptional regulator YiaG